MINTFKEFIFEKYYCDEYISVSIKSQEDYKNYKELCYFFNININRDVLHALLDSELIGRIIITSNDVIYIRVSFREGVHCDDDITHFNNEFKNYCLYKNNIKVKLKRQNIYFTN